MRPAAKGCFSGIGVGMWQKHVSYMWFGLREGVIIPATRSACAHSTGQQAVHKGRRGPSHCQMSAAPSGSAAKRPKAHFRACFQPVRVAGSTNNPSGPFDLGPHAGHGNSPAGQRPAASPRLATRPAAGLAPVRAAGLSAQKHPPAAFRVSRNSLTSQNNYTLTQLEPTHHLAGSRLAPGGDGMTLLMKKVAGLGLMLLGGLTVAHGGSAGQMWEVLVGLLVIMIGAVS